LFASLVLPQKDRERVFLTATVPTITLTASIVVARAGRSRRGVWRHGEDLVGVDVRVAGRHLEDSIIFIGLELLGFEPFSYRSVCFTPVPC
jgi:hypothetical protein